MAKQKADDIIDGIIAANEKGWAIEFRPMGEQMQCTFRRYGEVDTNDIKALGGTYNEALTNARKAWDSWTEQHPMGY